MAATPIVPFWNRVSEITRYPFQGGALHTLIALGLGIALLGWLPIIGVLFWIGAFKYAFEILQTTAHGRMQAPDVLSSHDNSVVGRYLALQFLSVFIPFMALFVSPWLGGLLFVAFVLVQPAAIMGLAMTGSLGRALDPNLWIAVMSRVGWPYLALFGLLLVIQLSAANASDLLAQVLPAILARTVSVAFSLWSLFAAFHLMGYIVFQYHQEFDFEPDSLKLDLNKPFNRDRELLEQAGERVQAGDVVGARALLREEIRTRAVSVDVHELYRRLLQQAGDKAELLDHGRLFLHLLTMEKQEKRAMELVAECVQLDRSFTALEVEQNAKLAKRAAFTGRSALAIDLLVAAIDHPERHADKPSWALQAAELLTRQSGRESEARDLLQRMRVSCDDPEQRARLDAQLAAIPA